MLEAECTACRLPALTCFEWHEHVSGQSYLQAISSMAHSWASRRFLSGCAVLFPMVVTVYITWWFLQFFDNFFSPIYKSMFGIHIFGLGFLTSMAFIFMTGVFVSSYLGGLLLSLGEWIIKKLPLVKHVYSAAKQVSAAVNPSNETAQSFRECVIIRHPRHGEFAFGFITGQTTLQDADGDLQLFSVYVPTNHVYVGDVFLLSKQDIIKPNLSVREGLEIVVSVGMALPPQLLAGSPT
eukprot:jgi/Astpho2/1322/e_gw1.00024.31.1_t